MGYTVNPAFIAAAIVAIPLAVALIAAMWADLRRSRLDQAAGVTATWAGLRLSRRELILGYQPDATRVPLAGLQAAVVETDADPTGHCGRSVHLTIEGHGVPIHRCRPYSYGSSGDARKLALLLNVLSRAPRHVAHQHAKEVA